MINIKHISKKYRSGKVFINALNDVSLHIEKGECVLFNGPSGSGKSTLLNVIGCLTRVSSGSYILEGKDVSHWPDHFLSSLRSKKMGFIFQQFNLISGYRVWENVVVPLLPSGASKKDRKSKALEILDRLNIKTRADFMAQELSGGQQQLVAIARALINNPDIILADEPISNIDNKHIMNVKNILLQQKNQGKTIIMTSHMKSSLVELVDHTYHFDNGSIS
jgi:putative ABC transport system ATP-binding protein